MKSHNLYQKNVISYTIKFALLRKAVTLVLYIKDKGMAGQVELMGGTRVLYKRLFENPK
jgi:hypothetical protein